MIIITFNKKQYKFKERKKEPSSTGMPLNHKVKKYFILSHAWEIKLLQQQSEAITVTMLFTKRAECVPKW